MVSAGFPHGQRTAVFVIGISLMMGCGFDAILKSPGPAAVSFVFNDTVLTLNTTVPLVVTVLAGGVPQAHPYLVAFSYNPSVFDFTAGDDSLIARRAGTDSMHIGFQSTLRAGVSDTIITIRVHP
jgi:hypothetical protein